VTKHPRADIYAGLPPSVAVCANSRHACFSSSEFLQAKYHYFNIPCSSEPNHPQNPLQVIKARCKPEDYVVRR
jgi:hypothetical protein